MENPRSPENEKRDRGQSSRTGVYLGKLRGIQFYLDFSWFFIAAITIYSLCFYFPLVLRGRSPAVYAGMAIAATLLFFLSILLHELGHSIVSQRCGIPVPSITLLFIGGVAEISREPDDARSELKIALAGPAVSLLLVALYLVLERLFISLHWWEARWVVDWLAEVNLALVLFNAIPGYPLDGGRVLRALLWMRNGQLRRATYITSRIGVAFSWLLIVVGILGVMSQYWQMLAFLVIGMFLKTAAASGYSQAVSKEILRGVCVRDLMTKNPVCIPASLPVNLAVDDYFLTNHHVAFPVVNEDGAFRGLLRLEYLKQVPREKWPFTAAADLASAMESQALQIPPEASAEDALQLVLRQGQGRLAVVDRGILAGIVTRHDLLAFIKIHTELEPA